MLQKINMVTVWVRDQDEALAWYTEKLGFEKHADVPFGPGSRWLTVRLPGQKELEVVLQRPQALLHGEEGAQRLLDRIGQGSTWVISTDDLHTDIELLRDRGVPIVQEPTEVPWGLSALITDLYGNVYNLVQTPDHPSDHG